MMVLVYGLVALRVECTVTDTTASQMHVLGIAQASP